MQECDEKIPNIFLESPSKYIYFLKIGSSSCKFRENIYKIGICTNLRSRIQSLRREFLATITVLAFGISENPLKSESELHLHFWDNQYSFLREENLLKWSNEYFKFETSEINEVFKILNKTCKHVTLFEDPFPMYQYLGDYTMVNGIKSYQVMGE